MLVNTSDSKQLKPILKWVGGKRQLLAEICENHLPQQYNTYYEPFLGGGALLFALQPNPAIINDINTELMNCYQVVRDFPDELIIELKKHKNEEEYYYEIRSWDRSEDYQNRSVIQLASRTIFLNKAGYNGLYRVNCQGQFNVPMGKYKNLCLFESENLRAVSRYLNSNEVKLLNLDFEEAVKDAHKGDFIYFDPPYDTSSNTAGFTGYNQKGFNKDEQERLKLVCDQLNRKGCKFLLSNACTNFIADLYKDYNQTKVLARRAINSNAQKRGKVEEILIKNYL